MNISVSFYRDVFFTIYPWYIIIRLRLTSGKKWNVIDALTEIVCTINENDAEGVCRIYVQHANPEMWFSAVQYIREVYRTYPSRFQRKLARKEIKRVAYERLGSMLKENEE